MKEITEMIRATQVELLELQGNRLFHLMWTLGEQLEEVTKNYNDLNLARRTMLPHEFETLKWDILDCIKRP